VVRFKSATQKEACAPLFNIAQTGRSLLRYLRLGQTKMVVGIVQWAKVRLRDEKLEFVAAVNRANAVSATGGPLTVHRNCKLVTET
jgi:hypothetical protein